MDSAEEGSGSFFSKAMEGLVLCMQHSRNSDHGIRGHLLPCSSKVRLVEVKANLV